MKQISDQWGTELMDKCFPLSHSPLPPKQMVPKYISYGFSEILQPPVIATNSIKHLSISSSSFPASLLSLIPAPWVHLPQKVLTHKALSQALWKSGYGRQAIASMLQNACAQPANLTFWNLSCGKAYQHVVLGICVQGCLLAVTLSCHRQRGSYCYTIK